MVVINTKKIFITILVSALLLVGSVLTVSALEYDFEFSAPNYNDNNIYFLNYDGYGYEMFNYVNIDDDVQRYFHYVGSFKAFYNYDTEETTKRYVLSLSKYGFDFLSQNGANAQSMKSVLEDFIDGNIGNISVLWGKFTPDDAYLYDGFETDLASNYFDTPQYFDVITDLNNQFFNYESQYEDILSRYNHLLSQYNELNSQFTTLQQNYLLLETNYNNSLYALEDLQNEYNAFMVEYRLLEKTLRDKVAENVKLSSDLTYALAQVESLETTISQMETVISQLETVITQLEENAEFNFQKGYTSAVEDLDFFESGIYTIFTAPFIMVGELAQIEIFGASIVKIVGIIMLFIVLSFVLVFIWKFIPFA